MKHINEYKEIIFNKKFLIRFIIFLISVTGVAILYNIFLAPNKIVIGGMSGLAIVINELTGLPNSYFLYGSMFILSVLSYFVLGKEEFITTLIGALCFTIMVSITSGINNIITINFKSTFLMILVCSISYGICSGFVYRMGFNTGGSDVIAAIINRYFKIQLGTSCSIVNTIIIIIGAITFGPLKTIYAILILTVNTKIIDIVILGMNDSKLCFIKSEKSDQIEKYLIEHKLGVTEINSKGGIFNKKVSTLLVIVPFRMYYNMKQDILRIDKKAFFLSHECYTVSGGYKKKLLPF